MNGHGPILVPLDGSELAEQALPTAGQIASAERTHLVLMSVWEPHTSELPAAASMEMDERACDYFQTYLGEVRERLGHKEIRNLVRCGDPSDEILAVADEVGARLIVIASHGRSGVSRWLYGSTTSRLLHESRVPLLVVGPRALGQNVTSPVVRHVMVPLDGSPLAELSIKSGIELASSFGAKLSLVRAVRWAYETYPYAGAATYMQSLDSEIEAGADDYIRAQESAVGGNVQVQGFVVRGTTADALLAFEDEHQVDLVVMTTHARSGLGRATLGSTAERMLQGRAPVLLLRPDDPAQSKAGAEAAERGAVTVG